MYEDYYTWQNTREKVNMEELDGTEKVIVETSIGDYLFPIMGMEKRPKYYGHMFDIVMLLNGARNKLAGIESSTASQAMADAMRSLHSKMQKLEHECGKKEIDVACRGEASFQTKRKMMEIHRLMQKPSI
ncbi:MAG: hypothetical protein Q9218_003976 [Villophora microphyllina]